MTQLQYLFLELWQKILFIREGENMMQFYSGQKHNDIYGLVEKMRRERDDLQRRINDA